jgi:uncharacterized Zn finger protein (UPF0148 family)
MSDFDKEAEREKLREQFERDRERREQSERMSELLLKGATMTNKHHDCGSPIFRWEGEEFCPTCESPVGAGGEEATAEGPAEATETPDASGATEPPGAAERAEGTADAAADRPTDRPTASDAEAGEVDVAVESPADGNGASGESPGTATAEEPTDATERPPEPSREPARSAPEPGPADAGRPADGRSAGDDVAAARASLERTLADVARQAEGTGTDDLARKRNLIAAAREAAEALEATRRAGRQ